MSATASSAGTFAIGGDLEVTRLGYGAMRITGDGIWGPPKDHDAAIAVLKRLPPRGVNFIDTADSYGPEDSENLIHEALHPFDGIHVATKGGFTRHGPNIWAPVGRPEYLRQCCLMSMRRLGVETIDLWQLHRIDPKVPREERTPRSSRDSCQACWSSVLRPGTMRRPSPRRFARCSRARCALKTRDQPS